MITSERARDFTALAHANLNEDRDHMIAGGDKLAWLAAQLTHYPTRVDPECTTNDRFLRMSAAATILAQQEIIGELVGAVERMRAILGDLKPALNMMAQDVLTDIIVDHIDPALAKAKGVKGG